jgi:rubrerythrin
VAQKQGLTALEVLAVAIKSEIEAALLYARMAGQVRNTALMAKLKFLQREEENHRAMLEGLYARRFPDVELHLPSKSLVPTVDGAGLDDSTIPEMFQLAMKAEQISADFYSQEADRSQDEMGRTVLRYLSNVERGHYHMLETEYDLACRLPDYYNADQFHLGDEMIHVGP